MYEKIIELSRQELKEAPEGRELKAYHSIMKDLANALYEIAGSYRDSTRDQQLKEPANELRNTMYLVRDVILPVIQNSLVYQERFGKEKAKELIKAELENMRLRLNNKF